MSHIHIPDGVLPLWLVALGWALAAIAITVAVRRSSKLDLSRRVPLLGAVAALMLVAMSSEIVPIAYHINFTVIGGIILGPWLAVICAAIVVTMLALVGHGGVTVIGLNIIVIASEMVIGWLLFRAFSRALSSSRTPLAAGLATVLTLALSTTLLVGIVWLGGSPAADRESGALDPTTLSFENPFAEGFFTNTVLIPEAESAVAEPPLPIARFAAMVYLLGAAGWLIEALVTSLVIGLVAKVRPSLIYGGIPPHASAPPGDEGFEA